VTGATPSPKGEAASFSKNNNAKPLLAISVCASGRRSGMSTPNKTITRSPRELARHQRKRATLGDVNPEQNNHAKPPRACSPSAQAGDARGRNPEQNNHAKPPRACSPSAQAGDARECQPRTKQSREAPASLLAISASGRRWECHPP